MVNKQHGIRMEHALELFPELLVLPPPVSANASGDREGDSGSVQRRKPGNPYGRMPQRKGQAWHDLTPFRLLLASDMKVAVDGEFNWVNEDIARESSKALKQSSNRENSFCCLQCGARETPKQRCA